MRAILQSRPAIATVGRKLRAAEGALAAGCDGCLPKPVEADAFPTLIAGYLERAESEE